MTALEKIDLLMRAKGMNRKTLAQSIGIPKQNIYNWYNRGCDHMALSSFKLLCDFFNVTMDSMAYDDREIEYRTDRPTALSPEEADLLKKYRRADPYGKQMVDTVANTALWQAEQGSAGAAAKAG